MKNKEPSVRSALMVSVICGVVGFINGVWVVLAETSYFYLAPLLGAVLGAVIGFVASRFGEKPATSFLVKTGAIAGGSDGFVSLAIIFLNVYAT